MTRCNTDDIIRITPQKGGILLQLIYDDDGACKKIVYCIEGCDRFDIFSYEMLRENDINGLLMPMRTQRNGMDAVQYDVSDLDTLKNYLNFRLSMRQLLSVFSQIISIVRALDDYLLDSSLLVTDIGQIYYDREKKEVRMIYFLIPGETGTRKFEERLFTLFKEIIFSAKFVVGDDDRYITELLNSINDVKDYSLADFKEVVCRLEGIVSRDPASAKDCYDYSAVPGTPVVCEDTKHYYDVYAEDTDSAGTLQCDETEKSGRGEPWLRGFVRKLFGKETHGEEDGESESYVIEDACGSGPAMEKDEDGDGETTVLVRGSMGAHTPYLIRSSNKERIAINKRVFKIGKDSRYADYIISDNAAVSRAHAEFMIKDGKIYLIDEDSLNNTYVNGNALVSRHEQEVNEGDVIMFADEEFVLYC